MTKFSRIMGGACIAAAVMTGSGAHAQTAEEAWQTCKDGATPYAVIASCTALIDAGAGDANLRSSEFAYRGLAYDQENRTDEAISDERMALQLNPGNEGAQMELKLLITPP